MDHPDRRDVATLSRTARGEAVPTATERAQPRAWDPDKVISWAATTFVALIATFMRIYKNDEHGSGKFLFDETYYAKDAWSLVHHGYVTNYVDDANQKILDGNMHGIFTNDPSMVVHPEVGKYLIGLSELIFGMTPHGWRMASAIVGGLMVFVMIRLARRVTGSTMLGLVAGILMTFDGLQFVLSRLALLDIFEAFFVLCAISCMVADRDWFRERLAERIDVAAVDKYEKARRSGTVEEKTTGNHHALFALLNLVLPRSLAHHAYDVQGPWGPRIFWRPWLLAAGIFWGLACGTKWGAIYPLAAFGILYWLWSAGGRRSFGIRWSVLKSAITDAMPGLAYLVLLPFVIYLATWTGWLIHHGTYEEHLSNTQYAPYWGSYIQTKSPGFLSEAVRSLRDLWHYHQAVWNFHTHGLNDATHPYQSNPEGWPVINKPVGVDAQLNIQPGHQGCDAAPGATCLRQVILLGTPVLWWFSAAALVWSIVVWIGRRDWRYGIVVAGVLASWLPWFKYDQRPIFSYYSIVFEPFLILGAVMLLGEILGRADASKRRRMIGAFVGGTVVVAVIANFAWFFPVYTDGLLTNAEWVQRIWFKKWI
ncbi:dolichyl-phosphate-mannose--protein mannosyltransferase [Nocardioides marmorisolisilvae]|uniref:dolichyl-phosphate-mannose--protein mannosyltransferase n=1 Tax=Nocardioides marmorisolisilvae TaxID=1542737 RepID=UPI001FE4EA85|nr:phospholipid carrier-dependent glycosyltransferase [Nocardioides marmorisolisilvae]